MKQQSRWRSKVLWAAIAAQLLSLLVTLDIIDTGLSANLEALVTALLELLVTFGVINSPTRADGV